MLFENIYENTYGWKSIWKCVKYCLKTENSCLKIQTKHPLVFSFHGCYFICFMKLKLHKIIRYNWFRCAPWIEFARSALRFSFHSKWMSTGFFLFTAFIRFLAMVSGFNSISLFLLFIYVAWLMVLCVYMCFLFFLFFTSLWN